MLMLCVVRASLPSSATEPTLQWLACTNLIDSACGPDHHWPRQSTFKFTTLTNTESCSNWGQQRTRNIFFNEIAQCNTRGRLHCAMLKRKALPKVWIEPKVLPTCIRQVECQWRNTTRHRKIKINSYKAYSVLLKWYIGISGNVN